MGRDGCPASSWPTAALFDMPLVASGVRVYRNLDGMLVAAFERAAGAFQSSLGCTERMPPNEIRYGGGV